MALTRRTLAAAVAVGDTSITLDAATGVAIGSYIRIDQEVMRVTTAYVAASVTVPVARGQDGTVNQAHQVTAGAVVGTGADFTTGSAPALPIVYPIAGRAREKKSYGVAGAITLPTEGSDMVAVISGTSALAMTVAAPTTDLEGSILIIVGDGKAAHTVTFAGGLGLASTGYTVATFITGSQQSLQVIAANVAWVPLPSAMSGTLTNLLVALA